MGWFDNTLGAIGGLFEEAGAAVGDVVEDIGTAVLGPLPEILQNAWDFSTGSAQINNTSTTVISNPGFWRVDLTFSGRLQSTTTVTNQCRLEIDDGVTQKAVWGVSRYVSPTTQGGAFGEAVFVVFLRSGDSLVATSTDVDATMDVWYRQIATVNGQLINPLGFSFA